jgi:hypothetical protein
MNNKIETLEEASRYFTADIPDDLKKLFEYAIGRELENKQHLKNQLLEEAEGKEPRFFHQIDGFANCPEDNVMHIDKNGDSICSCTSWELKNLDNEVRVLIHEGSKPEDVIRLLKKILQMIKSDPEIITNKNAKRESFMLGKTIICHSNPSHL